MYSLVSWYLKKKPLNISWTTFHVSVYFYFHRFVILYNWFSQSFIAEYLPCPMFLSCMKSAAVSILVDVSLYTWTRVSVPESVLFFFLQMLWKQVHNYPMFNLLMEIDSYMFACVNQTAVYEELEDETRRLCDVRPFLPVLKLVTRSCDPGEKLDSKIGVLIGKGNLKTSWYEFFSYLLLYV